MSWPKIKKKRIKKIILNIIAIIIGINMLGYQLTVYATESRNPGNNYNMRQELLDKSTDVAKHFRNSDGTFSAETYSTSISMPVTQATYEITEAVYNEDEDVNSILPMQSPRVKAGKVLIDTQNDVSEKFIYRAAVGRAAVRFHDKKQPRAGAHLSAGKSNLAFFLQGSASTMAIRDGDSSLAFQVDADTTVNYTVYSDRVKEDIVLHKYPASPLFKFDLNAQGLERETCDDGSYLFRDEHGVETFRLLPPTIADTNGVSGVVNMTIDGKTLFLAVDPVFLVGASYPVTIDPTVVTLGSATAWSQIDTSQADFSAGTLNNLITTSSGDLELATQTQQSYGPDDGSSLTGWTAVGATVNAGSGNPVPSLQALGSQYAYRNVTLGPNKTIEFDAYIIPGSIALCNFYFMCNSSGAGQMIRLEGRAGGGTGFAATTSWNAWAAPGGYGTVSTGVWHHVKLVIGATLVDGYIDGVYIGNRPYVNNGGYIAVHGDSATVTGGYFDNIQVYDTSARYTSGSRTSPVFDISAVGSATNTRIAWNATIPANTGLTCETNLSLDGGVSWEGWQSAANGLAIPGITEYTDLSNARLQYRTSMTTTDTAVSPQFHKMVISLSPFNMYYQIDAAQTDFQQGTLTGVVATNQRDLEIQSEQIYGPDDGSSLSGWTSVGATVNSSNGYLMPGLQATGGQYAYRDLSVGPNTIIEFDAYIIPGSTALCNFYFMCNSSGAGQMFRLEGRSGNSSGFASTTTWSSWVAPSGYGVVSVGVWHHVKLVIGTTTVEGFVDNISFGSRIFSNSGGYVAIHGDSGSVTGGVFDNLQVRRMSSGTYTSVELDLSSANIAEGSQISWNITKPVNTNVTIETNLSLDGGATWLGWQSVDNGEAIPGITSGTDLANALLQYRASLSTTDGITTPQLNDLTIYIADNNLPPPGNTISLTIDSTFSGSNTVNFGSVGPLNSPVVVDQDEEIAAVQLTVTSDAAWDLTVQAGGDLSNGSDNIPISRLAWRANASSDAWEPFQTTEQTMLSNQSANSPGGSTLSYDYLLNIDWTDQPGNYSTILTYTAIPAI